MGSLRRARRLGRRVNHGGRGAQRLETGDLSRLLTALIAAVSQQFTHVLLLKKQGRPDLADRLRTVNDTDFPNAMRIIELLSSRGEMVEIRPHSVAPALTPRAVLQAELEFEHGAASLFSSLRIQSPEGVARLAEATMARDAYWGWLTETLPKTPQASPTRFTTGGRPALFAALLQLMEQSMLHAFANWHDGREAQASTAWQISGAAMLYLSTAAEFFASDDPRAEPLLVSASRTVGAGSRFAADIRLVRKCAAMAIELASTTENPDLAQLSLAISEDCERVLATKDGNNVEAMLGSSAAFRDFRRTRRLLVP